MTDKMTAEQALSEVQNRLREIRHHVWGGGIQPYKDVSAIENLIELHVVPALSAPRVPEGWRTAREGKDWPRIGEKYLIRIGPDLVMQHEVFEFDQGDDGNGGGEFFWGRDDIDECPAFDSENDEWLPLSALLTAAHRKQDDEPICKYCDKPTMHAGDVCYGCCTSTSARPARYASGGDQ